MTCLIWEFGGSIQQIQKMKIHHKVVTRPKLDGLPYIESLVDLFNKTKNENPSPKNKFKFASLPIHKPFFLKDSLYECVAYQLDDLIPTFFCGSVVGLSN